MNILIISQRFWPEGGGGTLATYLITRLLANEQTLNISVITGTRNPLHIENVKFIIDPILMSSNKVELLLNFLRPTVRQYYKELIRRFDVVYIPYGYPVIPIAKELDKRVIVHAHDYQLISYNSTIIQSQPKNFLRNFVEEIKYELAEHNSIERAIIASILTPTVWTFRSLASKADIIICVSKRQHEIINKIAPELVSKLRIIYNPIPEVPLVKKELKGVSFMYLGGDSYIKGFHVLLRASQKFLKKGLRATFMLAGTYRFLNTQFAKKLGESYKILGHLSHEDVLKLYFQCLALLFPSITEEPLPYAVIEAMLTGTLPIASKVGGVPEIVQETYAEHLLFTPGDVNEMVDKMELVASLSKEQLIDIRFKLREEVLKKFDNKLIKHQYLKVFGV